MEKDILIIGKGNISFICEILQKDVQIDDFPGVSLQNFTDVKELNTTINKK